MKVLDACRERMRNADLHTRSGRLRKVRGLLLESDGPDLRLGDVCNVETTGDPLLAEVVAVHGRSLSLLAYGDVRGLGTGARVVTRRNASGFPAARALLGRVVDAFGRPLDGGVALPNAAPGTPGHGPSNPMDRPPVRDILETGVRTIDCLLTLGRGQRVGLFAGSGVGKSSLLASIARHAIADVTVIAMVGERSREVRSFVHDVLGAQALRHCVVIASSSDQPAPARVRAAHAAVETACRFAQEGRHVMFLMDSVTRLALARREIGLAVGEPPTARGFTPSVFAELPRICERCGTFASGGSVTAVFTVLVDGDDLNDPIADSLRSILDGHIVLSRDLAQRGHHPAIDVLRSVSRLHRAIARPAECELAVRVIAMLALLDRHRDVVDLGVYQRGANAELDRALTKEAALEAWMRQEGGPVERVRAFEDLRQIMDGAPT